MNRSRILRISLGFIFVLFGTLVATYEYIFDTIPGESFLIERSETIKALKTCDPNIVEKIESEEPLHIRQGDTLSHVLRCASIPSKQVNEAILALKKNFNPRNLRPKHKLFITTSPSETEGERELLSLIVRPDFKSEVVVLQNEDGSYSSELKKRDIKTETKAAKGNIKSSFYIDAANQGVPGKVLHELIKIFSYQIDFQRNIKQGDGFEVLYDVQKDVELDKTIGGNLTYAALNISGEKIQIYRHKHKNGDVNFYNDKGESIKKAILQTPVDGARISSRFGRRRHPVLGYTKMHKGIDFAVPRGTPIMAAGDGVIDKAGWVGGYGKYVRIRHTNNFKTAYAHLSRFAKGLKAGKRVKQGDIIAYSGNTGRTTGPHLHYEVLKNNKQINPQSVRKIPGSSKLKGNELNRFNANRMNLDKLYVAMVTPPKATRLASAGSSRQRS